MHRLEVVGQGWRREAISAAGGHTEVEHLPHWTEPGDFGTASLTPGSEAAALFAQQLGGSAALSLAVVDLAAVVGWLCV